MKKGKDAPRELSFVYCTHRHRVITIRGYLDRSRPRVEEAIMRDFNYSNFNTTSIRWLTYFV